MVLKKMDNKINVILFKNPFKTPDREIRRVEYIPGNPALNYIRGVALLPPEEIDIIYNDRLLAVDEFEKIVPVPGEFLAVVPKVAGGSDEGGKNLLQAIAMIAIMVLSVYTGGLASAGTGGAFAMGGAATATTTAGWTFWGYAAAMATQYAGGLLIQSLFPPPEIDTPSFGQTYGWGALQSTQGQGNPLNITFGEVKTAGQVLAQHVNFTPGNNNDYKNDKQYLNILLCGGEGPCDNTGNGEDGNCTGISDIRINGTPVSNFKDVTLYRRAGLNDQTYIPSFSDNFADQFFSYKLGESDSHLETTEGYGGTGLELAFDLPMGLANEKNNGNTVQFTVEHRRIKDGEGNPLQVGDANWVKWQFNNIKSANYLFVGGGSFDPDRHYFEVAGNYAGPDNSLNGKQITVVKSNGERISNVTVTSAVFVSSVGKTRCLCTTTPIGISSIEYTANYCDISNKYEKAKRIVHSRSNLLQGQYEVRCKCIYIFYNSEKDRKDLYWNCLSHITQNEYNRPNKVLLGIKALATDQLNNGVPTITWTQKRSKVLVWNPNLPTPAYVLKDADNPAWACYDLLHMCRRYKDIHTGQWKDIVRGAAKERMDYDAFLNWASFCTSKQCKVNLLIDSVKDLWEALKPIEILGRGKVIIRGTKFSCIYDGPADPVQLFTMANMELNSFTTQFSETKNRANAIEVSFWNKAKNYERDTVLVHGIGYDEASTQQNPTQITLYGCDNKDQAYREGYFQLNVSQYLKRTVSWVSNIDAIACMVGDVVLVQHELPNWGTGGRIVSANELSVDIDHEVTIEAGKTYKIMIRYSNTDQLVIKEVTSEPEIPTSHLTVVEPFDPESIPEPGDLYAFGEENTYAKPFRILSITRDSDLKRRITALEYIEAVYEDALEIPVLDYTTTPGVTNVKVSEHIDEVGQQYLDIVWTSPRVNYYGVRVEVDGQKAAQVDAADSSVSVKFSQIKPYTIRIITLDYFGHDITAVEVSYEAKGEPLPGDVQGLTCYFNGGTMLLSWQPLEDSRLIMYEVRKGMDSWETAQYLGRTFTPEFIGQGDGQYWVAGYYRNLYSAEPKSIYVMGSVISANNVYVTYDEEKSGWTGSVSEGAIKLGNTVTLAGSNLFDGITDFDALPDLDFYGDIQPRGIYTIPENHRIDIGEAELVSITDSIELDAETALGFIGDPMAFVNAVVEIRIDPDGKGLEGHEWQTFTPGQYNGRVFDFRVVLTSTNSNVSPVLRKFGYTIDMADKLDRGQVEVAAEGSWISFNVNFHVPPQVQITELDAHSGDTVILNKVSIDARKFWVRILDENGAGAGRSINWLAKGY
jgi:predicted phage tail protein